MCFMICDRMLQSIAMLQWKPSVQAAASIYLARKYLGYEDSWVGALAGGDLEHVAGGVHGREEGGADAVRGGHSRDHHEAEPAAGGGAEVQELAIQSHLQQRTDQDAAEGGEEGQWSSQAASATSQGAKCEEASQDEEGIEGRRPGTV